jgi:hypothetical protein
MAVTQQQLQTAVAQSQTTAQEFQALTTAEGGASLIVTHVASGMSITINDMLLRTFRDKLNTKYNSEDVFGRMDPIMTYQGTSRDITLGFDLGPFTTSTEAAQAMASVSRLMQMQYPVYEKAANGLTLQRPPLVKVQFANYIRSGTGGGLLCAMKGMTYSPFDKHDLASIPFDTTDNNNHIVTKRISVDLELAVLHEQPMGFQGGFADAGVHDIQFVGGDGFSKIDFDKGYPTGNTEIVGAGSTKVLPSARVDEEGVPDMQHAKAQLKVFGG